MSDIFISYAREDRARAQKLASDLTGRGYSVWWDAELVGTDDYYEVILQALHDAKAAIVIWSPASCKSRFVRDEARFALHLDKLVATKTTDLDAIHIPFGFQSQHADDVADTAQILKALEKQGVKPSGTAASAAPAGAWSDIAASSRVDEIVAFLGTDPPADQRRAAVARLKELTASPGPQRGATPLVKSLTASPWQAFLSALLLRAPKFQLSTQGTWASVGQGLAIVLLVIGATALLIWLFDRDVNKNYNLLAVTASVEALLAWVSWRRLKTMADQKNAWAAAIITPAFAFSLGVAVMLFAAYAMVTSEYTAFASDTYQATGLSVLAGAVFFGLALGGLRIYAAR